MLGRKGFQQALNQGLCTMPWSRGSSQAPRGSDQPEPWAYFFCISSTIYVPVYRSRASRPPSWPFFYGRCPGFYFPELPPGDDTMGTTCVGQTEVSRRNGLVLPRSPLPGHHPAGSPSALQTDPWSLPEAEKAHGERANSVSMSPDFC